MVTWQPPITSNGIVRSYCINYVTGPRCVESNTMIVPNSSQSASINNLEIFTTYRIQVFATTITKGDGSEIVYVTTDEDSKFFWLSINLTVSTQCFHHCICKFYEVMCN